MTAVRVTCPLIISSASSLPCSTACFFLSCAGAGGADTAPGRAPPAPMPIFLTKAGPILRMYQSKCLASLSASLESKSVPSMNCTSFVSHSSASRLRCWLAIPCFASAFLSSGPRYGWSSTAARSALCTLLGDVGCASPRLIEWSSPLDARSSFGLCAGAVLAPPCCAAVAGGLPLGPAVTTIEALDLSSTCAWTSALAFRIHFLRILGAAFILLPSRFR
mmetsp:Transcript_54174/g.131090  ORF Transcript_54174/g.131090 Transcript_54174/m.131090 type:complete len:220 (-) Transcript_54174:39-698(-)